MADEVEMVVIDGVRYRKEHAPKATAASDVDTSEKDEKPAKNKMRSTNTAKRKSS